MRIPLAFFLAHLLTLLVVVGAAAQEPAPADPGVSVRAAAGGLRRYEPGTWSLLALEAINQAEQDSEITIFAYFDEDPTIQFARTLWVPAASHRKAEMPIWVPENLFGRTPNDGRTAGGTAEINTVVFADADRSVIRKRRAGQNVNKSLLRVDRDGIKTAILYSRIVHDPENLINTSQEEVYETVTKARLKALQSRVTINLSQDFLPSAADLLESMDQVVITSDEFLRDTAGADTLRSWLHRGGRAWIMVDRVRPESIASLIGNAVCFEEVDRVEVTDITVDDRITGESQRWVSEVPVELVRVFTDSTDIYAEVDGWPVAFWQPVGSGEVLMTTLGARGWRLDPRTNQGNGDGLEILGTMGRRFFDDRSEAQFDAEDVKAALQEQIGYRIPSRRLAALFLGGNSLGLLLIGVWLARIQRLEWLAVALPVLTLATTAAMLVLGGFNTRSVPSMVATMQLVQVAADTEQAHASGIGAIYAQAPIPLELPSASNGWSMPSRAGNEVGLMEWDDDGRARWRNLETATGSVRFVEFRQANLSSGGIRVHGRFGPRGLEARIHGAAEGQLEDMVIVAPPSLNLTLSPDDEGRFTSGSGEVLAPAQFLSDRLVSDEQNRRLDVYRRLLDPHDERLFPQRATLFAWSREPLAEIGVPSGFEQRNTTLSAIPLSLEPTPPGSEFHVPSTFLRTESALGKYGASTVYNPRTATWNETTSATNTTLRFVLPKVVRPCRLTRAVLTMKINAPSRTVEIRYPQGDDDRVLRTLKNPTGVVKIEIDDPAALQLDERGGVQLGISVSRTARQEEARAAGERLIDHSYWRIDYTRLDVYGRTAEP